MFFTVVPYMYDYKNYNEHIKYQIITGVCIVIVGIIVIGIIAI